MLLKTLLFEMGLCVVIGFVFVSKVVGVVDIEHTQTVNTQYDCTIHHRDCLLLHA
jgi:hypothetical protein